QLARPAAGPEVERIESRIADYGVGLDSEVRLQLLDGRDEWAGVAKRRPTIRSSGRQITDRPQCRSDHRNARIAPSRLQRLAGGDRLEVRFSRQVQIVEVCLRQGLVFV